MLLYLTNLIYLFYVFVLIVITDMRFLPGVETRGILGVISAQYTVPIIVFLLIVIGRYTWILHKRDQEERRIIEEEQRELYETDD